MIIVEKRLFKCTILLMATLSLVVYRHGVILPYNSTYEIIDTGEGGV